MPPNDSSLVRAHTVLARMNPPNGFMQRACGDARGVLAP